MTKNSNRTTLWDDESPVDVSAPPQSAAARGAWRSPTAVLSGERPGRRVLSAMPVIPDEDEDLRASGSKPGSIPRRTKFAVARNPWWRPRSTFGRALLGTGVVFSLAALVAAGVVTRRFLARDPHFRIPGAASIQSSGLSEVSRAEVLPVFGEDIGRNIFFVPLAERRKQLEAIPWVQQATVMRFLPDRLSVSIVERTPVALVMQGNQVELADADGVILSMPPAVMAQHHYSFPVVQGINPKDSLASRRARMAVYQRFAAELDQNGQHRMDQVSEIDLTDPEDLRATMPEQGSDILAHFGEDHFLSRLELYKAHIAEWRGRYPKLIGVDLRYNGEVPLEMATDTAAAPPTTANIAAPNAAPVADLKPSPQTAKVKTASAPTKADPVKSAQPTQKSSAAAQKAAEAKLKAAKLHAAKLRAAKAKAAHKTQVHPAPAAARQGL